MTYFANISRITVSRGQGSVQKRFVDDGEGHPVKDPNHRQGVWGGETEDLQIEGLQGLADLIGNLESSQALALGCTGRGKQRLTTEERLSRSFGVGDISRTQRFYHWPEDGYFFLLLDYDPITGQPALTFDQLWGRLAPSIPEFKSAGRVVTASTSSFIYDKNTGECLIPQGGWHIYIAVKGNVERFRKILAKRFWHHNKAYFKLSSPNKQTGVPAILERYPLDLSVFSPERIVYEAGACFEPDSPFEQRRPLPQVVEGNAIDLDSIPELTPEELEQAEIKRKTAKTEIQKLQEEQTIAVIKAEAPKRGHSEAVKLAKERIRSCEQGFLAPDHLLYLEDSTTIRAGEIGPEHNGVKLRDPQEPDYHGGAIKAQIYWNQGDPRIHSFAHGGKTYKLASQKGNHSCPSASANQKLTKKQVKQQLEQLIQEGVSQSDIEIQIAELAKASGYQTSSINRIYLALLQEAEFQSAARGTAGELDQLKTIKTLSLPIEQGLYGDGGHLAAKIRQVAEAMPTAPEFLVTTLIPVFATAIGTSQKLSILSTGKYKAVPIFRTIIVAQTGRKKTPAQRAILDALFQMEKSAALDYRYALAEFEQEHRDWLKRCKSKEDPGPEPQKPTRKSYITLDSTPAALVIIHFENPRGILRYKDEASAFFTELGRFISGSGDGGEFEADLSEFNGGIIKCNRKGDGEIFLPESAVNRVGATQFRTLKRLMGSHNDDCGEFARYLFCAAEAPPSKIDLSKDVGDIGLTSTIMEVFDRLYKHPDQEYILTSAAKTEFEKYQHELTDRQIAEDHPALESAYPKFETYFGRFILWLHVVNAALAGVSPAATVDSQTVEVARQWTEYFIGQFKVILAINSPQQELTGDMLKVFDYLKRKGQPIDVRTICQGRLFARSADKNKQRAPYLRHLLDTLVEQGWIVQEEGFYLIKDSE